MYGVEWWKNAFMCKKQLISPFSVAFRGIIRFATSQGFSGNGFQELLLDQLLEPVETWAVSSWSLPILGSKGQHTGPITDDSIGF